MCERKITVICLSLIKASDKNSVLKTETGVTFTNGTASNCPVEDARAISVEGTFLLSYSGLKESAVIAVTAFLNGSALSSGYSNFTILIGMRGRFYITPSFKSLYVT